MSHTEPDNVTIGPSPEAATIITHSQDTGWGPTGHFQLIGIAFDNDGNTWANVTETKGLPVRMDTSDKHTFGNYVADMWACVGTAAGASAMNVDIVSSAGLTVNAIVEDLIVGITSNLPFAQIGVYGTGGTAVGMTGSVYIIGATGDMYQHQGIAVFGTGGSALGGDVGVTGYVGIDPSSNIGVYGTGGSALGGDIGVTGYVGIDSTSLVGISGGITIGTSIALTVTVADGLTHGGISGGLLLAGGQGVSLGIHGLSSGVRVLALSTGSTAEYVYVGGGTSGGLTGTGYPLREMDDVFIEIDNLSKVCIVADNADAKIRYIGS